jgi:propanol-preferring alcohol dehydrogenase
LLALTYRAFNNIIKKENKYYRGIIEMRAMVLKQAGRPLELIDIPVPEPKQDQILLKVRACGICRTDLHIIDGELTEPKLPLVLGHQIIGEVMDIGPGVESFKTGDRVGVPWLGGSCGACRFCKSGRENLCDKARYTGYQIDGGLAEMTVADERFCFPIPGDYPDDQAAPLLCAGLIGYRALKMTGDADHLGFYGFGAAAHILIQVAQFQKKAVYAFTRPGDVKGQQFAKKLGAVWAGGSDQKPPRPLDAAIIFAPVGDLVPQALGILDKGAIVVCAGIHMSDIPAFPYRILWEERSIKSVANLTRQDGEEFMNLAPKIPVRTEIQVYPLAETNRALNDLRHGRFEGAAVITIDQ